MFLLVHDDREKSKYIQHLLIVTMCSFNFYCFLLKCRKFSVPNFYLSASVCLFCHEVVLMLLHFIRPMLLSDVKSG